MTALSANLNPVANILRMLLESANFDLQNAADDATMGGDSRYKSCIASELEDDDYNSRGNIAAEDFKQILRSNNLNIDEIDEAFEEENRAMLKSIEFSAAYYTMQSRIYGVDSYFDTKEWHALIQHGDAHKLYERDYSVEETIGLLLGYGASHDLIDVLEHLCGADEIEECMAMCEEG